MLSQVMQTTTKKRSFTKHLINNTTAKIWNHDMAIMLGDVNAKIGTKI